MRQQVIGKVVTDDAIRYFDQPPGQRRQLVITELPLPAISQRLDQIERQIGVKQRRKGGPNRRMQEQNSRQSAPGGCYDPVDNGKMLGRRHRLCGLQQD